LSFFPVFLMFPNVNLRFTHVYTLPLPNICPCPPPPFQIPRNIPGPGNRLMANSDHYTNMVACTLCTVYTVQCTQCTLYTVYCTLCTLYIVHAVPPTLGVGRGKKYIYYITDVSVRHVYIVSEPVVVI